MNEFETIKYIVNRACKNINCVIEAGCFNGQYSNKILTMFPRVKYYFAFEPDPRNIPLIKQRVLPRPFKLIPKALGAEDGIVDFYQSDGMSERNNRYTSSSSIRKPKEVTEDWVRMKFKEPIKVSCTTLDTFCKENNVEQIDLIFADVQGAERDIIAGGKRMLSKTKFIFLEHSLRAGRSREWYEGQWLFDEMVDDMDKLGFNVYSKFPSDILFYNRNIVVP